MLVQVVICAGLTNTYIINPYVGVGHTWGPPRGGLVICVMCKHHLLAMCNVSFYSHYYVKFNR